MKQLPLSRGLFATVDDADFDFLSQWKWSAMKVKKAATIRFYAVRVELLKGGKQKMYLMHRVIAGAPKGKVVDHRDNDSLNNRRANLRVCTQSQNMMNATNHADSPVKSKGVCLDRGKYRAAFRGKYLGFFPSEVEAAAAYDRAAVAHNQEFALTNEALAAREVCYQ